MSETTKQAPEALSTIDRHKYRRVLLKTDSIVLPLLAVSMTLAFLDKNALAFAAVWGLKEDTHLVGQQYSWLGSIFYFGYLFAEFPNLWIIPRVPIGKYIGGCLILWGMAVCLIAKCHNFGGIAAIRFLLGVFEASLLPCMMFLNSMWYRREEQPLRTALWGNTFAGVFGGILSYAIGKMDGSLPTWKYIFIIYGSITIFVGIIVIFCLPDSPSKAWFFSEEEKEIAILRLAQNQTGVESSKTFNWSHIREAMFDPKWLLASICIFAQAITNAGITNFNPLIISGYGFSQSKTVLMATPQAAIAMVAQAGFSAITMFVPNLRCIFWVLSSCIALAGAVMVHLLDAETQRNASLAGVYLMGFYNVPFILTLSLQSSNTAGTTKKSFVSVSAALFYALGNIVGPQFFLEKQSPHYQLGIGALLCAFSVMAASGIAYYIYCVAENKKRDGQYGKARQVDEVDFANQGDVTDMDNTNFRYTY